MRAMPSKLQAQIPPKQPPEIRVQQTAQFRVPGVQEKILFPVFAQRSRQTDRLQEIVRRNIDFVVAARLLYKTDLNI